MGKTKEKKAKKEYVAEEHGPVYNFLYSYKTHFYQLMTSNIMLLVLNIPMIVVAYFLTLFFLPWINDSLEINNFVNYWGNTLGATGNDSLANDIAGVDAGYQLYYILVVFCVMFLVGTSLICVGPFQAGFHQLYRNLHRQEGIFLLGDFKEGVKTNWKQSLVATFIGLGVTVLLLFCFGFYLNSIGGKVGILLTTFFGVFFLAFILIQNMVYQLIVTVDLPLTKIYRNAILFSIIKLGPCIGILALAFLLIAVIPFAWLFTTNYGLMGLTIFYYAFFVFTFVQYMIAFATGEFIDEYIVSKLPPKEEEEDEYMYYPEEEANIVSEEIATNSDSSDEEEFQLIQEKSQADDDE